MSTVPDETKELIRCSMSGDLPTLKQLLGKHKEISPRNSSFLMACQKGHMNIIKYLLFESDPPVDSNTFYITHEGIHKDGFYSACSRHKLEVINFFLYDLEYKVSPQMVETIKRYIDRPDRQEEILFMVEKRDLFFKLKDELSIDSGNMLKRKI